jgi:hypothetical protein
MDKEPLVVRRLPVRLIPDPKLTITRLFWAGAERAKRLVDRVLALDDTQASHLLALTMSDFGHLHDGLLDIFRGHFEQVARRINVPDKLSNDKKLLIGAYFTLEYSFASAAVFNPSMTPSIDQAGVPAGALRFAMSRGPSAEAISSIIFRRASSMPQAMSMEPVGPYHQHARKMEPLRLSQVKPHPRIMEKGVPETFTETVLGPSGDAFTMDQLRRYLYRVHRLEDLTGEEDVYDSPEWIASCDYDIETFPAGTSRNSSCFPFARRNPAAWRTCASCDSPTMTAQCDTTAPTPLTTVHGYARRCSSWPGPAWRGFAPCEATSLAIRGWRYFPARSTAGT